jgi:hypothetical protein
VRRGPRALCVGIAAAAALVAGVAPLGATESTIYPGVGIGKVRLGMTLAQVEHALGRDYLVDAREPDYLELGWNFSSWTVGFQRGRAVLVSTTLRSQKARAGAGPGASWPRVVHAYPGGRCTFNYVNYFWRVEYLVPHRGGTQTLFTFRDVYDEQKAQVTGYVVTEASVRTAYRRLPEFAPNWADRCADGWSKTALPLRRQH